MGAVTKTEAEAAQEAVSEAESESEVQTTEPEENRMQEQVVEKEEPASQNNNNSSPKEEPEQKNDTDFGNGCGSSDSNEGQSEKEESGNSNEESGFAAYNPQNVVSLATAKCQAGGMITTQQNLDNLLAAGKITQEEYNEYYPYDGMEQSYYSVFVETDLNTASTLSGKRLPTEDAIAEYIAGMLLLENDPVFYISYEGIYTTGSTDFYRVSMSQIVKQNRSREKKDVAKNLCLSFFMCKLRRQREYETENKTNNCLDNGIFICCYIVMF